MATMTKLGPADHGRPMTQDDFQHFELENGFNYELIDGRLYVSPQPDQPENSVEEWLGTELRIFAHENPEVINYVSGKARVFVPSRPFDTIPEPDLACYRDYPYHLPRSLRRWEDLSPVLVVEILGDNTVKDLKRNVELYLEVPSIREYWVIDTRQDPDHPSLIVYRRWGKKWRVMELASGDTYTTKLLPGFELTLE